MASPQLRSHQVYTLEGRIDLLRDLVWAKEGGLNDPLMRELGLAITQNCRARDDLCELNSIFWFTVHNVRYTGDQAVRDTFQSALRTLQFGGEDCDGHSVLNALLCLENGFLAKWRITSNTGASWDHIYCMAGIPKMRPSVWIALDTTLGVGKFGKQPRFVKSQDFLVASPSR